MLSNYSEVKSTADKNAELHFENLMHSFPFFLNTSIDFTNYVIEISLEIISVQEGWTFHLQ